MWTGNGGMGRWTHDFIFRLKHGGSDKWSVAFTHGAITIFRNGRLDAVVKLAEVKAIYAVSRNLVIFDRIFLILKLNADEIAIGEHYVGFEAFLESLQLLLPTNALDLKDVVDSMQLLVESDVLIWEAEQRQGVTP